MAMKIGLTEARIQVRTKKSVSKIICHISNKSEVDFKLIENYVCKYLLSFSLKVILPMFYLIKKNIVWEKHYILMTCPVLMKMINNMYPTVDYRKK